MLFNFTDSLRVSIKVHLKYLNPKYSNHTQTFTKDVKPDTSAFFFPGVCLKCDTQQDIEKARYLVDMIGTSNLQKKLRYNQKISIL